MEPVHPEKCPCRKSDGYVALVYRFDSLILDRCVDDEGRPDDSPSKPHGQGFCVPCPFTLRIAVDAAKADAEELAVENADLVRSRDTWKEDARRFCVGEAHYRKERDILDGRLRFALNLLEEKEAQLEAQDTIGADANTFRAALEEISWVPIEEGFPPMMKRMRQWARAALEERGYR